MADQQRALSYLVAALADNTTKAVTEQVLRDFLVSVFGGFGGVFMDPAVAGPAAQTINIAAAKLTAWNGTFPAIGTTPDSAADNITVAIAAKYQVQVELAFLGSAGKTFTFQLYKNGGAVQGILAPRLLTSGTDITSATFGGIVDCAANDVLEIRASADVDAQSVTVRAGQFTVKRVS